VVIGVPTGESFFFGLGIVSRCFLLRLRGRGFGEAFGFSGERSVFVMVIIDRSYVGSSTVATWEQQKISFELKTRRLENPDVCKNVVLKIMGFRKNLISTKFPRDP
jgi:hypothetical protein